MSGKKRFEVTGSGAMLAAGIFALAAAIYGFVIMERDAAVEPSADIAGAPGTNAEPEFSESQPEELTPAEVEQAEAPSEAPQKAEPDVPVFDVVRINPEGGAVIAGSAAPGAKVTLLADGVPVADAVADASGKFVALFDLPPSEAPRSLSAEAAIEGEEAVASAGTVLIAPTRPAQIAQAETDETASTPQTQTDRTAATGLESQPKSETAQNEADVEGSEDSTIATARVNEEAGTSETESAASTDVAGSPTPNTSEDSTDAAEATDVIDTLEPTPASPAIVLADESGVTVLQPAPQPDAPGTSASADVSPQVAANLVIDTITYDTEGEVALSGRGESASFARVYLNDQAVRTVKIEPDGTWRTPLPDVDAGVYRLRIDEVSAEGTVTSRVETPFQREEPAVVTQSAQRPNAVTVQEGFTLWAIAKDRFGSGFEYVRVYEANRDLIRDPDLIYPGQIFELPEG